MINTSSELFQQRATGMGYQQVRSKLLKRVKIALLDKYEETPHSDGYPLFAYDFPRSSRKINSNTTPN